MNAFILTFHPRGRSLVEYLVDAGYEAWTAHLRGQGGTRRHGAVRSISFADWCDVDLPVALDFVNRHAQQSRAVVVGCSLGGTVAYGYLARRPQCDRLRAVVALGAPLRWPRFPAWIRPWLSWPDLFGRLPIRGTRTLARTLLPVVRRVPMALSVYMNTAHIALDRADLLTQTVDDPPPGINAALIQWLQQRDLVINSTNVTEALGEANTPLLAIYANGDGIVPPDVARTVVDFARPGTVTTLEVGDSSIPFAHADMFINDYAESRVFAPLLDWLTERG